MFNRIACKENEAIRNINKSKLLLYYLHKYYMVCGSPVAMCRGSRHVLYCKQTQNICQSSFLMDIFNCFCAFS